jgi:hypothetical protein
VREIINLSLSSKIRKQHYALVSGFSEIRIPRQAAAMRSLKEHPPPHQVRFSGRDTLEKILDCYPGIPT